MQYEDQSAEQNYSADKIKDNVRHDGNLFYSSISTKTIMIFGMRSRFSGVYGLDLKKQKELQI